MSRTLPIVFVTTIDPVGSGLVASLARPGGNATGFIAFEFSLNAKVLELLKAVAPGVTRVAVIRDPSVTAGSAGFAAVQTAVGSSGMIGSSDRLSPRRRLRRSHSQGRETGRPASAVANQIQFGDQLKDCQSNRLDHAPIAARDSRQGDRIDVAFCCAALCPEVADFVAEVSCGLFWLVIPSL